MNVLLLGSGGREHAIAWKTRQSPLLTNLFWAPGNAAAVKWGIDANVDPMNFQEVEQFCLANSIDMIIVGPEAPLVEGIRDHFKSSDPVRHIHVIGPGKKGALLEGSKSFAKVFMKRHHIPTAEYREFSVEDRDEAVAYLDTIEPPFVIKADGLAAGKGVVILDEREKAKEEVRQMLSGKFGDASKKLVIEAFLKGIEFSVFALTDGKNYVLLPEAKDYKRIGENDTGLNTGGMGAVSPVPFYNESLKRKVIERIVEPTISGLQKDGIDYKGFIFFGLIDVDGDPFVIEYNCRLGDPESEAIIPKIENDWLPLFCSLEGQTLNEHDIQLKDGFSTTVMLVSGGYPEAYEKGKVITGIQDAEKDVIVFHAGTKQENNEVLTNGGRVISLTGMGRSMEDALSSSYSASEKVNFEKKYFRRDIGKDLQ
jgi:phosphoribosylamine--glycine ligase